MKLIRTLSLCGVLVLGGRAMAIDLSGLQTIGPVKQVIRADTAVLLRCSDHSEVQVSVLATDLIRVRAAFKKELPARDHSWAIEKSVWTPTVWTLQETATEVRVCTETTEVVIKRDPLIIEFRDVHSHRLINADQQPMAFDPKSGLVAAAKSLGMDEHFFGLGEKAARLDKRRGEFSMWTTDTPGYVEGSDPLYQSIPFYLGWEGGAAYGIFFDNSYRTHFDFGHTNQEYVTFSADGGEMNYYFFAGPSFKNILGRYADLTGHMPLFPRWALGNQQSRYSYYPDTLAEAIARRYRDDDLPLDVLHLDIHYMEGYRDFTWNKRRFPDPAGLAARLGKSGVKLVTIVDPGVKYQPVTTGVSGDGYSVFNEGLAQNFFLRRKNGDLYIGRVWPGESVFVDYTKEAAARWWGDQHRALIDQGVAGIWMDMNEPTDFIDKSGKTQADVVFDDGGTNSSYAENRNLFALGMARATFDGLTRLRPTQRPFLITRAGYAGIQRYSTMWTGDNTATWESLALSLPMFESIGMSGEPFVGCDIPGYRGEADGELLARWYEVGFLTPLCRNHAENTAYDHEPWRFGSYYEGIVRKYLKLRYRLMPFLYTTMEEAHRTGMPIIRPLLLNYQEDPNTLTLDSEFMVGADLLVAPITKSGQTTRQLYLPKGEWYDFWTGMRQAGGKVITVHAPLEVVPLFVRGGSVIPSGPEMNFVGEKPVDPLRFDVYPDESGAASSNLYEDDGLTTDYLAGKQQRLEISYISSDQLAKINLRRVDGEYHVPPRTVEFVVHDSNAPRAVQLDGQVLNAVAFGHNEPGWLIENNNLVIRLLDNGDPHSLQIVNH